MSCLAASAQLFNGTLYFTTNAGGQDVHSITYSREKLGVEEISRRLLLEYLLWAESARNLCESRA